MTAKVYIGTSGWNYEHWKGTFYPEGLKANEMLEYYSGKFKTVEINNTFYIMPSKKTVKEWKKNAPEGFVYAPKVSRYLTHMKKLKDPKEPLKKFIDVITGLGSNLGPLLYQLPPNWKKNPDRLKKFVNVLPPRKKHAFEFRDPDWYDDEILQILNEAGCAFVVHDMPDNPSPKWYSGNFSYIRFHGLERPYKNRYGGNRLKPWARWIKKRVDDGMDVYVFFNNDAKGHAPKDATSLKKQLKKLECNYA